MYRQLPCGQQGIALVRQLRGQVHAGQQNGEALLPGHGVSPLRREYKKCIVSFCADNGVVAQGVTQTDSGVTAIVAGNMLTGKASVCCMSAVTGFAGHFHGGTAQEGGGYGAGGGGVADAHFPCGQQGIALVRQLRGSPRSPP